MTRCKHIRTRCIHGDEIWMRMSWTGKVYRRACLDCGKRLNLPPLCASEPGVHVHN